MSLVGIRDMSIIETPPKDCLLDSDERRQVRFPRDCRAIRHELERGGQVYIVHRIGWSPFSRLATWCMPRPRTCGRGARPNLAEDQLERAVDFISKKYDVLLFATTIIEMAIFRTSTPSSSIAPIATVYRSYECAAVSCCTVRPMYPADSARNDAVAGCVSGLRPFASSAISWQRIGVAVLDLQRRRQPPRRRTKWPHRDHRVRDVHEAARAGCARAEGRGVIDDVRAVVNLRVDQKLDASVPWKQPAPDDSSQDCRRAQ